MRLPIKARSNVHSTDRDKPQPERLVMKRLTKTALLVILLFALAASSTLADDCFTKADIDRVAMKGKLEANTIQVARRFFAEHGFCPRGTYIAEQLKLSHQHPEMFDGPLQIYEMDNSYGVPGDMSPQERDHYIFYYGDPTGAVSTEIFDSRTDANYQSVTTDENNLAQSVAESRDHIRHELKKFVTEIQAGTDPDQTIERYLDELVFGPNEDARAQLENSFRRALGRLCHDIQAGEFDLAAYAYELSHLRAAVWEEQGDLRNQRLERQLKYR